jgi:hypothetical protein
MHHMRSLLNSAVVAGLMALIVSPVNGQTNGGVPAISERTFASGSITLTVTGAFEISEDVPINATASIADGEWTWLQFGVSGAEKPNALITYGDGAYGVSVSRGKRIATADGENCSGRVEVTGTGISGQYTCNGVTSYDPASGNMGKVNIVVRFTART